MHRDDAACRDRPLALTLTRPPLQELVDRLGVTLGGRGFGLNEEFHHVLWVGDLNTHVQGVPAEAAVTAIVTGHASELLLRHDELLAEKDAGTCFFEYEEPLMSPRFLPTYKKVPGRGRVNYRDPEWPSHVFVTSFKEPFYKGGRVRERVPSWTDRVQYHSLPSRSGDLLPELLDPAHPESSPHNYHAVNDGAGLDVSDHSPVFATFTLAISAEETDDADAAVLEAAQGRLGYGLDTAGEDGPAPTAAVGGAAAMSLAAAAGATATALPEYLVDADFAALPPAMRPVVVHLRIGGVLVDYRGAMRPPRAVSVLFPLPYEDSNELPERAKIIRQGRVLARGALLSETRDAVVATVKTLVTRQSKLEGLHLLLKVSLDDGTKAQTVVCMRDGGFIGVGSHQNMFLLPLTSVSRALSRRSVDAAACS